MSDESWVYAFFFCPSFVKKQTYVRHFFNFLVLLHFICITPIVDGKWTVWEKWSICPVTCGGGVQDRSRTCTNPPPAFGGAPCVGASKETRSCNERPCPGDIIILRWSSLLSCTFNTFTCAFVQSYVKNKLEYNFCIVLLTLQPNVTLFVAKIFIDLKIARVESLVAK